MVWYLEGVPLLRTQARASQMGRRIAEGWLLRGRLPPRFPCRHSRTLRVSVTVPISSLEMKRLGWGIHLHYSTPVGKKAPAAKIPFFIFKRPTLGFPRRAAQAGPSAAHRCCLLGSGWGRLSPQGGLRLPEEPPEVAGWLPLGPAEIHRSGEHAAWRSGWHRRARHAWNVQQQAPVDTEPCPRLCA